MKKAELERIKEDYEPWLGNVHRELLAKGFRVFYGRKALAVIPKPEKEPYIFSAG